MSQALTRPSPRLAVAALALTWLCGCSADAVHEPAPTLELAGTFIALPETPEHFRLLRVRNSLEFDAQHTYIFLDEYRPGARSLDHARALARDPDLILRPSNIVPLEAFERTPHFVIWHRSLRDDERD